MAVFGSLRYDSVRFGEENFFKIWDWVSCSVLVVWLGDVRRVVVFMLYEKRKKFNKLSEKIGLIFSKLPISPNQWTISSLFLALLTLYFLINNNLIIAFLLSLITISIDMIDGAVARATNRATVFGAYLDTVTDRLIEFSLLFGLLFIQLPNFILPSYFWIFLLSFGSFLSTYTKSAAFEKKMINEEMKGGGIIEHTERVIIFSFIIFLSLFYNYLAIILVIITTIFTFISSVQRFKSVI